MYSLIPYVAPKATKSKKSWKTRILEIASNQAVHGVALFLLLLFVGAGGITRNERVAQTTLPDSTGKAHLITGLNGDVSEVPPTIPENATEYIQLYKNYAIESYKNTGVLASITLAQGLIESNAGKSRIAREGNNHFGIKCFSRRCRKGHCMNATDDSHKDFFLKFSNPIGSYVAHGKFLKSKPRYRKLFTYGKDYRKWAYGLKKAGYATDRTYATKLIGVIEKYDLHKYD
jgi:flagellum-specific peptidoglycan hydrolase FlgJ